MTAKIAFIDSEWTGTDVDLHEIWEVALLIPNGTEIHPPPHVEAELPDAPPAYQDAVYVWHLPLERLEIANPYSLNLGRFHERYGHSAGDTISISVDVVQPGQMRAWAAKFVALTNGLRFVGSCPAADEKRLERLVRRHGHAPMWHYQPLDVEQMALGWLRRGIEDWKGDDDGSIRTEYATSPDGVPPWMVQKAIEDVDFEEIVRMLGISPSDFEQHTALGDVMLVKAMWDRMMGDVSWKGKR